MNKKKDNKKILDSHPNFSFIVKQKGICEKRIIPFVLFVILAVFIVYPIIMLLSSSIMINGKFSLSAYKEIFTDRSTYIALWNTIKMELGILIIAWVVGGSLAILRHKTNFKHKKWIDKFVFLSLIIPSYILAISWIEIFSRGGYIYRILKMINSDYVFDFNAYSLIACSIVLGLHLYPHIYYGVGNSLKMIDNNLISSAKICATEKKTIVGKIIIPLVLPSFISTALLIAARSMANFGVTAQLALPSGKEVLTTRIYSAMSDLNLSEVAVLSIFMILLAMILFLISEKYINKKNYAVDNSSNSSDEMLISLGRWEKPITFFMFLYFTITTVLPFLVIFLSSFFKRWGLKLCLKNLTLNNYRLLFADERLILTPLFNSIIFGLVAATISVILASLIVYMYTFRKSKLSTINMTIAQLSIIVPNIILAVAALFAWINEPIKLYGTAAIIIVTYSVLFIPICIKQISGGVKNLDSSFDDAGKVMGISLIKRYIFLFIPQIKDSILAGFVICFLISLKEIPISLLLYTVSTKTLGVLMFTIQTNSYGLEMTSAVSVVVILLSVLGNFGLNKIRKIKK